jgi:hypothetical protein
MFMAPPGGETMLLRVAAAVERGQLTGANRHH